MPTSHSELKDIQAVLARMRSGKLKIHLPQRRELHRKRPKSHFHAIPELFIQTGGATDFDCAGECFRLLTGDICVMPRGVPHRETPVDLATPYSIICICGFRDGVQLRRAQSDISGKIYGYNADSYTGKRFNTLLSYLDDISRKDNLAPKFRKPYMQGLLEAYFCALCSELAQPRTPEPNPAPHLVAEAEKYVHGRLSDSGLTVAGIATTLNCTADHLSRQFHRVRGLTLTSWIAQERIAQACNLLEDPGYNISEIGWACGFNEPSYFIRIFKRHMGMTPRQFRLTTNKP
ncbi:helix-turn-helix transcriptional regulator [Ruficoccus sp. ZRK36]|uniref:helix-turn-helix transcriptional regulator n=1 Tax=Ruficoccus sp. ZRK36 TaxID=2866311 RepID=UPI001C737B92|nr:helix-turn-helix transcriptional regulator [Ruficoccus sp. ZRK36]QYY35811.1 helix-turn-helix transcriptional regulator [Ruficoccus sp. ZRK36]